MSITTVLKQVVLFGIALGLVIFSTMVLFGQDKAAPKANHNGKYKVSRDFCTDNNWSNGERVSFKEVREMTLPGSGSLRVDGGKNGGVSVKGENRSDILVKACVNTWAQTDEAARAIAGRIKIATSPEVRAEADGDSDYSVSYEIRVPQSTNLKLNAHNGGISINSVDGMLEFETMNGGVNLQDVAGDVIGKTTNGGVNVKLSGSSWKGNGLNVTTSNGGVNLTLPSNYAANIETGTVNGGFKSDIPSLSITTEEVKRGEWPGHKREKRISTSLNGGGAPVKVITTNGGIRINSAENE